MTQRRERGDEADTAGMMHIALYELMKGVTRGRRGEGKDAAGPDGCPGQWSAPKRCVWHVPSVSYYT